MNASENNIRVLPMAEEDLPAVAELERRCFAEPWSENALRLFFSGGASAFVVKEGSAAVAYGGMLHACDEGQITDIAVLPEYRRRGYGRAILSAIEGCARENGLVRLSLEVRESNEAAIRLYTGAGFVPAGRRKHFYRFPTEDALILLREWNEGNL